MRPARNVYYDAAAKTERTIRPTWKIDLDVTGSWTWRCGTGAEILAADQIPGNVTGTRKHGERAASVRADRTRRKKKKKNREVPPRVPGTFSCTLP